MSFSFAVALFPVSTANFSAFEKISINIENVFGSGDVNKATSNVIRIQIHCHDIGSKLIGPLPVASLQQQILNTTGKHAFPVLYNN